MRVGVALFFPLGKKLPQICLLYTSQNKVATFEDNEYPPVYDRTHSLKIFLNCEAGRRRRCAFAATCLLYTSGYEQVMDAYHVALKEGSRFGTYGDAMRCV